ncbi:helix-turn-helix transcriptional regulator [Streptomyces sp. GDS52]|uniref:helix-turn-helix transcriptional regulator n=1 Tax=Streptomyces sp. GDS52 TaxID=3406419 RepID=UPI003FCFD8A0
MLGSPGRGSVDAIARHVSVTYGREANVRRVGCRREAAGTEHAVLRRLLGASPSGHEVRYATHSLVCGLLARGPLVLAIGDAQWCDEGTLRFIDQLMRATYRQPLTVLLHLPPGLPGPAAATFHELATRDYCTVIDAAGLRPADTARPASDDLAELALREPRLLEVALAAAALGSTDPDLVGALAGLPSKTTGRLLEEAGARGLLPGPLPAHGTPSLLDTLPEAERERLRAQAAEILNDAARPAEQVADLLLEQSTLDRSWMRAVLREAAAAARHDRPAAAVSYLTRLHAADADDAAVRMDLATALIDIDPLAARKHLAHLAGTPPGTGDPLLRAHAADLLRLTSLMVHDSPDTPAALDALLREPDPGRQDGPPTGRARRALAAAPTVSAVSDAAAIPDTSAVPEVSPVSSIPVALTPPTPSTVPVLTDHPTERMVLAVRALRTALTASGPDARETAVADARQVLWSGRPHTAWARVAAARVLALADDTATALDQLQRTVADSAEREETWAECHAASARALVLLESGRAAEAAEAASAASRLSEAEGTSGRSRLASITLAHALVARGDLDRAQEVLLRLDGRRLDDCVWEHHHRLTALALVERGRGRPEQALRLFEQCGAGLAAAGVGNPVFSLWWVHSTELLMRLGQPGAAAQRADFGRQLAERWPTARSTGLSLLARGVSADPAGCVELLTESARILAQSSDRQSHALAELRLGKALLHRSDRGAPARLRAALATAARYGLASVAEQARYALRSAEGRHTLAALSHAERPVAELAAAGKSNRAIADALHLTVRTVEYHLTNVYRKLGIPGRAGLARWFPAHGPQPAEARAPGGTR